MKSAADIVRALAEKGLCADEGKCGSPGCSWFYPQPAEEHAPGCFHRLAVEYVKAFPVQADPEPAPPEPTFGLAAVRSAFWMTFHKKGEFFFSYLGDEEENESSTQGEWEGFLEHLGVTEAAPKPTWRSGDGWRGR